MRSAHAYCFKMGFSRMLLVPVTEKEALLPLPKAGVNVCS